MTKLFDDPTTFSEDLLEGFCDLYADRVLPVPGGVVRATETPSGKVAVVVGGGSGHYPAFCGIVGPGFADGAVVGNVFTSPSTKEAVSVGRAAAGDSGLLFSTGNYAGDVMNFTLAQQQLAEEGIDTRVVFVTDDIASAPLEEITKRRGIAGDFVVFRVAGAAAEAGYDLDHVESIARRANDRTRTMGVAFAGCTLPGADTPLFEVANGQMGVGLGIHGEPGIADTALPSAAALARTLVDSVLAEAPADDSHRVGVILNGLGATKYEELFVVWKTAARLLRDAGYTVVDPEVGELVTSLDMAGCSLTLVFLDHELEGLWTSPADTPAYRKGSAAASGEPARRSVTVERADEEVSVEVSDASRACAATAVTIIDAIAEAIDDAADELGRIDAVAGDGDHGRGMKKGTSAARDAVHGSTGGVATLLNTAGGAWAAKAGGTSGVLWGAALAAVGNSLGDTADRITAVDVAAAIRAGVDAITTLGKAKVGDKTMLDALVPFVDELDQLTSAGMPLAQAWSQAAATATEAADATAALRPLVGRARPLAEKSVGTPDAGAISIALCLRTASDVLNRTTSPTALQETR
jgi:D-erythrulose 4-kinase